MQIEVFVTNLMEQSPWASNHSASQEITCLLCNLCSQDLPLDPILSQMNHIHILTPTVSSSTFSQVVSSPLVF